MGHTSLIWASAALVVIDVQNDFVSGPSAVPGTFDILPQLRELTAAFRASAQPIVHVVRLYDPSGSDADLVRREIIESGTRIVTPGSNGAEIPQDLMVTPVALDTAHLLSGEMQEITPHEVIMYKPRWSAFYRTQLEDWLAERQISSLVVAGCNLPNCPRATLFDATERDLRAAIVEDATSRVTPERLNDLKMIGVEVYNVATVGQNIQNRSNQHYRSRGRRVGQRVRNYTSSSFT